MFLCTIISSTSKQAIKLSGVVLSSESVVIWSLLLCNFRSRKPSLFYGIPVLPALYDLLDDLWMYLLWVNVWVWLFLIACKYFVYLLVWIFTDFCLIWVLDIFNLELNCILLIDYIGYFKLEDYVFSCPRFFFFYHSQVSAYVMYSRSWERKREQVKLL